MNKAIADFEKKFKDKTRNKWAERSKFSAMAGKYTLIEMDDDDDDEDNRIAEKVMYRPIFFIHVRPKFHNWGE